MTNRLVFTLTTLPSRIKNLGPTLKSLINQTIPADTIYLTLPYKSKRLGKKYPKIPKSISKLCEIVRVKKDYGPITKILGALIKEKHPDTLIITVDDDIIYPPNMTKILLHYHRKYPDSALGSSGLSLGGWFFRYSIKFNQKKNDYWFTMKIPPKGKAVDILYGYSGVLYKRDFFPSFSKFQKELLYILDDDMDLFRNDDITLSFYLNKKGIERRIIRMPSVLSQKSKDALSDGTIKFFRSLQRAVRKCQEMGWGHTYESVYITETFTGVGLVILIVIVVIILLVMIIYEYY